MSDASTRLHGHFLAHKSRRGHDYCWRPRYVDLFNTLEHHSTHKMCHMALMPTSLSNTSLSPCEPDCQTSSHYRLCLVFSSLYLRNSTIPCVPSNYLVTLEMVHSCPQQLIVSYTSHHNAGVSCEWHLLQHI